MSHLTEDQVHAAAFALIDEGQSPGIEAVARRLGRGSRTTIHKYLQTFWPRLAAMVATPAAPDVPTEIADLLQELWTRAQRRAQAETDARVRAREEKAAALEHRSAEAISEARQVAQAASAELAKALDTRALAEQRAEVANKRAEQKATALAESEQRRDAAETAAAHAAARCEQLQRHLTDVEASHVASVATITEAHAAEIARLLATHDRELDRVRVALDAERTRTTTLGREHAQRESRLQEELAAARAAQLTAATAEARLRAEKDGLAQQLQARSADVQRLEREVHALQRANASYAAEMDRRADWVSPEQLKAAVAAGAAQTPAPLARKRGKRHE
ncbi:hypothetical protein [Dolichospermum phage Dfl-JY45]